MHARASTRKCESTIRQLIEDESTESRVFFMRTRALTIHRSSWTSVTSRSSWSIAVFRSLKFALLFEQHSLTYLPLANESISLLYRGDHLSLAKLLRSQEVSHRSRLRYSWKMFAWCLCTWLWLYWIHWIWPDSWSTFNWPKLSLYQSGKLEPRENSSYECPWMHQCTRLSTSRWRLPQ